MGFRTDAHLVSKQQRQKHFAPVRISISELINYTNRQINQY